MSKHLGLMNVGESILVQGPKGRLTYLGNGHVRLRDGNDTRDVHVARFGMMAGGTGITPMLQIIRAILKNPADRTEVHLIFANQTEEDILLHAELEACAKDPRVKLWYTLDRPTDAWKYSKGYITEQMIQEHLPPKSDDALVCGASESTMFNRRRADAHVRPAADGQVCVCGQPREGALLRRPAAASRQCSSGGARTSTLHSRVFSALGWLARAEGAGQKNLGGAPYRGEPSAKF